MSNVDDVLARHELELQNANLEDEMVALKASGDNPERLRAVKAELRELRKFWRGIREWKQATDLAPETVDGFVSPPTIEAKGDVQ